MRLSRYSQPVETYRVDGYLPTIGLECHVQLQTVTKLFTAITHHNSRAGSPNEAMGPLCLGLPGALPVLNQRAVELAIQAGLALECQIAQETSFDRKHYFYPDLPLGYQISQHYQPLVLTGKLVIPGDQYPLEVRLDHAHLEADAGKLSHPAGTTYSLLNVNRVGAPLLEIVSQPDMHSPEEAKRYAKELYLRMLYAGVSQGDLSAGNLRFDVNVSVSPTPDRLGTRTEIKNLNSFRFIHQAVAAEIKRQVELLAAGQAIVQETRGWDERRRQTVGQRSKEDAQDYRYMPDPDIPPLSISLEQVAKLRAALPVLPPVIRRVLNDWQIAFSHQTTLLDEPALARLLYRHRTDLDRAQAKLLVKWLIGDLLAAVKQQLIKASALEAAFSELKAVVDLVLATKISPTLAKQWLLPIVRDGQSAAKLLAAAGGGQISDETKLQALIDQVFKRHSSAVAEARTETKVIGFLVGQVMQLSRGQANPQKVNQLIRERLAKKTNLENKD